MRKLLSLSTFLLASLFFISACSDNAAETAATKTETAKEGKGEISILYPSWAEGIAMTYLAKVVLEDEGFVVKTTLIEPGPLYASLSKGDADLYLDAWLPSTHKDYWERFGDQLEKIGTVFDDASSGLVVPTYVEINSIDELNANQDQFAGKIYGIGAGAGLHGLTIKAIEDYNLDFEQLTSSESSMMAALRKAIADKTPIIITGWKPHYMWSMYDLKLLEDPKNIFQIDKIEILSRKGFTTDHPQAAEFFKQFSFNSDQLHELIADVGEDSRNPEVGARKFYDKYKAMIDGWLK